MKLVVKLLIISAITLCSVTGFAQEISDPLVPFQPPVDTKEIQDKGNMISTAERVRVLLSGYEYFPSRQDLDKVGGADLIVEVLESFAEDRSQRPSLRLRAIDALGFYNSQRVQVFLRATIERKINADDKPVSKRTLRLMQSHAITSYAKAFKKNGLVFLKTLAESGSTDTKISAIYGIGKHCGDEGRSVIAELKKSESNRAVLTAIGKFKKRKSAAH